MKKFVLPLIFCIISIFANAQNRQEWTLQQCVDYALKNNISVKQSAVQARVVALQLQQTKMYKLPSASLNTSLNTRFGRSIDISTNGYTKSSLLNDINVGGSINIFSFNKLKNEIAAQEFNAKAALADVEKTGNDIALTIANYYLQALATHQQIEIIKIQTQQTSQNLQNTRKRVEAGSLPELNALEIEAQLATDSSNLVTATMSYEQSLLTLKGALNLDAAQPFAIAVPNINNIYIEKLVDLQPENVYTIAITNQPNVKANLFRIEAAKKNVLSSKSAMYPSISGSYSFGSSYMDYLSGNSYTKTPYFKQLDNNFSQSVGVQIAVPIFNYGSAKINNQQSQLTLQNAQLQQQQIEQKLKLDIYTAYTNAINALQKVNTSSKQVEVTQKAFDLATKRYDVGMLNTLDLLTNQNNLLRAKMQNLADKYDYVFKMKLLEFYKGQGLKL